MMSTIAILMVLTGLAQHPQMPPEMSVATHHFRLEANGGSIEATVKAGTDAKTLAGVRGHLRSIARDFTAGDFTAPLHTHGELPSGAGEMKRLRRLITYRYADIPSGGVVRMATADPSALAAIHAFLRYQITEHATGDSLEIRR